MTTRNHSSDTPHDCVGHCVGTASENTPRATARRLRRPAPLPYGGRHSQRAPLTASATTASTASDTRSCRVCGCTEFTPCGWSSDTACWWVEIDLCSACQPLDGGPDV